MKDNRLFILFALAALLLSGISASAKIITPAFPGAEGFGRYVTGGRGGKVYHVTSLADDPTNVKEGTLRYAINQSGARTIVFDVAGTIHLKDDLYIRNGNVTIAGQTSPGGICIGDRPFAIRAQNVIVRYLRIRPGDLCGTECDGFGGFDGGNFIIDHCSVSWSVDECISAYGNENTTVQWCLASQPLNYSVHPKTRYTDGKPHCYGGIWGGDHASFHHNLIAHAASRTPRFGSRPTMADRGLTDLTDCRNNVFYNWCGVGCYGGSGMQINMVNNYIKPGPATDKVYGGTSKHYRIFAADKDVLGIYATGNVVEGHDDVSADNWPKGIAAQMDATAEQKKAARRYEPYDDGGMVTFSAAEAYDQVVAYVGACDYRDNYDQMILADVTAGEASYTSYTEAYEWSGTYEGKHYDISWPAGWCNPGVINTQNDVVLPGETSPWVAISTDTSRSLLDSDGDGIPDSWEDLHGLDPDDPVDGLREDACGYTMLEVWMNSLVATITAAPYGDGEVPGTKPEYIEDDDPVSSNVTATWTLDGGTVSGPAALDPATAPLLTNSTAKGFTLGTRNNNKIKMTSFTADEKIKSASADHSVTFEITPDEGYEFMPTAIAFDALRIGTDGGLIDVFWKPADGNATKLVAGLNPDRDNYSSHHYDISAGTLSPTKEKGAIQFCIYSLNATKAVALANVVISGTINEPTPPTPPDGIRTASLDTSCSKCFDLSGRPSTAARRGIVIYEGKKVIIY